MQRLLHSERFAYALVALFALVAGGAVELKARQETDKALATFREEQQEATDHNADEIGEQLSELKEALHTIAVLPSVRSISRHGENLDDDARSAIEELYAAVNKEAGVSQLYIVPNNFNPERLDPTTGSPEAPTATFGRQDTRSERGVDIFEFREMEAQQTWLRAHAPTAAQGDGPPIVSNVVITSDNSVFATSHDDRDRLGVAISTPFYDATGRLAGSISAIVRVGALAASLPSGDYALIAPNHAFAIFAEQHGQAQDSARFVRRGRNDPRLLYSSISDIGADEHLRWRLWAGVTNAEYAAFSEKQAADLLRWSGLALVGLLTLLAAFVIRRLHAAKLQNRVLEERVSERTTEIAALAEAQAVLTVRAESANKAKSQFLANMSHELRTPLNAIIGYSEMIAEDAVDDRAIAQDAERIQKAGKHLLGLINQVLDLSKIEAGKTVLQVENFNPAQMAREAAEIIRSAAEKNGTVIVVEAPANLTTGCNDPLKLNQCLLNLLANAAKFTSRGTVKLSLASELEQGREYLVFTIADTGIGMSREQIISLFKPFAQADDSITRKYGGTGLGLSITRALAHAMGGDVSVDSEIGKGSTFVLRVPRTVRSHYAPELKVA